MEITFNSNREIDFYLKKAYMTIDPNKKVLYLRGFISRKVNANDVQEIGRHYAAYMNNNLISVGLKKEYDFNHNNLLPILEEITSMVIQQNLDIHDILNLWEDENGAKLISYINVEPEK